MTVSATLAYATRPARDLVPVSPGAVVIGDLVAWRHLPGEGWEVRAVTAVGDGQHDPRWNCSRRDILVSTDPAQPEGFHGQPDTLPVQIVRRELR
ncbi:hypothetical protein E1091_07475 [Micromonospora fluostatini]|uniref:Uncharacterized protein n=1 Tax=Micromonospora fluostatini TaxID=1629071 RepID=A0ABY2DJ36_9ACTN|nr:hypothetical protein E1091_07475 [Micromonospora fluostatini]